MKEIALIINESLKQKFPDQLKISKLTPLYKNGEIVPSIFRPINQLNSFRKIIEKSSISTSDWIHGQSVPRLYTVWV